MRNIRRDGRKVYSLLIDKPTSGGRSKRVVNSSSSIVALGGSEYGIWSMFCIITDFMYLVSSI